MKRFPPLLATALLAVGCTVNVTNPVLNTKMDNNVNSTVKTSGKAPVVEAPPAAPVALEEPATISNEPVQPMSAGTATPPMTEKEKNQACLIELNGARDERTIYNPTAECLDRIKSLSHDLYEKAVSRMDGPKPSPEPTPTPRPTPNPNVIAAGGGN